MSADRLIIEHVYTRDDVAPRFEDGEEVGWRFILVPPNYSDAWVVFDTRSDRKTGWRRIRWGTT